MSVGYRTLPNRPEPLNLGIGTRGFLDHCVGQSSGTATGGFTGGSGSDGGGGGGGGGPTTPTTPAAGPSNVSTNIIKPAAGPSAVGTNIIKPTAGPSVVNTNIVKPVAGPSSVSTNIIKPLAGPSSLSTNIVKPVAGPDQINSTINTPAAGPSALLSDIPKPAAGPSSLGSSIVTDWTPLEVTTEAWFDASDASTLVKDASNIVSQWNDKSGNNHNLTGLGDPVTQSSTQNSLNVLDLDGGDYFELNNLSTPTSGNLQAFIVCEVTAVSNNADCVLSMDAASNDWQLSAGNSSQFRGAITFTSQPTTYTATGTNSGLTGFRIFCADLDFTDDGQYRLLVDGELLAGTNQRPYTSKLAATVNFRVFANRAEDQFPEGSVAEVLILDNTDNTVRQKVEGYLAHKWGLANELSETHPYKSSAPASALTAPAQGPSSLASEVLWSNLYSVSTGTSGGLTVGETTAIEGVQNFSQAFWFKSSKSTDAVLQVSNTAAGSSATNWIKIFNQGGVQFRFGGASFVQGLDDPGLNDGEWHFLVQTYSAGYLSVYVDGAQVGVSNNFLVPTTAPAGWTDEMRFIANEGNFDEWGVWDVTLDAANVLALYNNGSPIALDTDSGNYTKSQDLVRWEEFNDTTYFNPAAGETGAAVLSNDLPT